MIIEQRTVSNGRTVWVIRFAGSANELFYCTTSAKDARMYARGFSTF